MNRAPSPLPPPPMGERVAARPGEARSRASGFGRGFTVIEMLVVISVMALLATLIVGVAGLAGRKARENDVRGQLHEYVTAIEDYKAKFGFYPPDHGFNKARPPVAEPNSVSNQLLYELTGVLVTNAGGTPAFVPLYTNQVRLFPATVLSIFKADGFANSALDPKEAKPFLPNLKPRQHGELVPASKVDVLVVPVPVPKNQRQPTSVPGLNPWHYVSSGPTNNPNSFDLWAEVWIGGKFKTIGNWRE